MLVRRSSIPDLAAALSIAQSPGMTESTSTQSSIARALLPLFVVQFACWSGMFLMWIGAYPIITSGILQSDPANHRALRQGMVVLAGCFSYYATVSALLAFGIPALLRRTSPPLLLGLATAIGAGGLAGLGLIDRPILLVPCFTALAVGWCALSNLPYTIAGKLVPWQQIDHWFRIFAFSSILPQLAVTAVLVLVIGDIDVAMARRIMQAAGAAMLTGSLLAVLLRKHLLGNAEEDDG